MHRVFGIKEPAAYTDREGAYLIPVRGDQIGVVQTPKGYFFLGGGLENGESHKACLERECLEEAGYTVTIKHKICSAETYTKYSVIGYFHPIQTYYIGDLVEKIQRPMEKDHILIWTDYEKIRGKMFLEMQNWALEQVKTSD